VDREVVAAVGRWSPLHMRGMSGELFWSRSWVRRGTCSPLSGMSSLSGALRLAKGLLAAGRYYGFR
jgi:hypothetical protein